MSEQNPVPDAQRPVDPRSDLPAGHGDLTTQTTAQGPTVPGAPQPPVGATPPVTPAQGSAFPAFPAAAADLEATLPLTPAVTAPAWASAGQPQNANPTPPGGWPPGDPAAPWAPGQPPYGQPGYGQQPYGQAPYGQAPYGTPIGGTPVPPYVAAGWDPTDGPQAGTAYGTRPPTPPTGLRRGATGSGGDGSGRTPSAVIVGSVIGVAAILALAVWFVLLRPGDNTASGTPTPGATTFVTPPPTATPEASFSFEPGASATPEPTRFRNPTFAGLRLTDAEDLASRSRITIRVTYEVTDEVDPDTVISQDPPAGDPVLPGDTIVLTVAAPAPTVAVPDLRDFMEADAVAALLDAGLAPGERTEAFDADTEPGRIVRTDPRGGLQVARETLVDYTVSLGVEPSPSPAPLPTDLPAPSLIGLTSDEAQALADAHGFVLVIEELETLDGDEGAILTQEPDADTPIRPGDLVRVVVAVRPATVVVPTVRELVEADAVSVLIDAGLTAGERSEAFDAEIAAGAVIRTDPRAGIAVAPGTSVDYVVSLGAEPTLTPEPTAEPVLVPDLVGLSVEEAQALIDDTGLVLETLERETLEADPGIVLEQDPVVDTPARAGATVQVVIAARPSSIAVPPLRGLPEDEALATLQAAALVSGERTTRFHASIPAGAVIRSDPAAGTIVALDTTVDYVVSLGVEPTPSPSPSPAPIDAPGLTGRTLVDAQAFADANGILLEVVDEETDDAPPDTILDQDPPEGTPLRPGDTVRVRVARQPANVIVPTLRGLSEADAIAALLDADLTPGDQTQRFHATVPAGSVISSDPRAGASVARGSAVDRVLSRGPEPSPSPAPIVIPSFVGGPVGDAQRFADEHGLTTDITTRETPDAPPDLVLAQDPGEGGELRPGGVLHLVVATPPTTTAVPDVRGQSEADAITLILDAGLAAGGRTERFHASVPAGAVIRTSPVANEVVPLGTVVDYLVSRGPEPTPSPTPEPTPAPIELPRLVGGDRGDAQAFADANGLRLDVTEQETPDAPEGTILDQDPPAGETLAAGATLRIVVAIAPALVTVPDVRGESEADGIALLTDAGLTPGRRIDRFNDTVPAERIIRTDPAAEQQVGPGTVVDYVVSRGPEPTPTPNPAPELRGLPRADAQALAEGRGFTLDVIEQETPDAPPDTVIDQDPAPDTDLPEGSTIRVTVAVAPPLVTVPALRGLSEADGIALLTDAGLIPGRRIDRFNDAVPADQIVRTDPAADEQVPAGTTVDYVVSKGREPVPAPDLVGIPIEDARALAEAAGLTLDVTEQDDDRNPTGTVLSQDPRAGDPLTGSTIAVVVARNTQLVSVPALRGLSEADGISLLTDAGLTPGRRIDRFNDAVPADRIVRTDPAADTQVAAGTTIDYVVSKGPEPVLVPDVTGIPVDQAEGIARDSGLTLDIRYEDTGDVAPDTVLSQDPAAGAPADGSGTVRVMVARARSTVEVPRLRGLSEADAIALLLDAGLEPGDRTERNAAEIPEGFVTGSDPRPGTQVEPGTRVSYVVSRGPGGGTATPEPTAEPTAPPTTDPGDGGDPTALLDGVVADVPPLRELDLVGGIPYRALSVREWRRELKAAVEAVTSPEAIAAEAATLARLGLIPPDLDLEQARLDLLANGVVAWYDPTAGVLNVIEREGAVDAVVRFFAAGEVDKALVDGLVGLSGWRPDDLTQTDRAAARAALLGGDQALLMIDWAGQALSPDEQALLPGLLPTNPDLLASAPLYLRRQLTFPTDAGRAFVEALRNGGGWAAVNDAYARPPASTEQILHPEKYREDRPVAVELPDLTGILGGDWFVTDVRTFGELGIGAWLDDGADGSPNGWAADGWGGDRAVTLDGPDGAWAVVWQTAWDSDTDADEFSGMADQAMADLPGAHVVLRGADMTGSGLGAPALVVVASDRSVLDTLLSGSGLDG